MHNSIDTAVRERRTSAPTREAALWISDEELTIALRAAGASGEDIQRYLASEKVLRNVSERRRWAGSRRS